MIFLLEYDRQLGKLVSLRAFADDQRAEAYSSRLTLELQLHDKGTVHEVVLLEAVDEAAIRKTHRRYFSTLEELTQTLEVHTPKSQ